MTDSAASAKELLRTQYTRWGQLRRLEPLEGGWDNHNFLVVGDQGKRSVLRRYRTSSGPEIAAEIELLKVLNRIAFPTPKLLRNDANEALSSFSDSSWSLFDYLADCRHPSADEWQIGVDLMYRLHLAGLGFRGPSVRQRFATLGERLSRVPAGRFQAEDWNFLQAVVADESARARPVLDAESEYVRVSCVHHDVNPRNVLIDPHARAWLIDFDEYVFAPITIDLAGFIHYWSISEDGRLDLDHARAVVAAYHSRSPLTPEEVVRLPAEMLRYQLRDCLKYCLGEMDEDSQFQLAQSNSFRALHDVHAAFVGGRWGFEDVV